jgi:hypothetical protein
MGSLSEAQFKAGLSTALGLSAVQVHEFLAEMCGELDADLFAYVASLRPRCATAILSNAIDGARPEGIPAAVRPACRLARRGRLP